MESKDTLRGRLARARAETIRSGRVVLGMPVLLRAMEVASWFLLAAVLSGGRIFGSYAPFGVALVGGAGSGINAACALLGSVLGYLTLHEFVDGLRYVSAAILTFSVAFAFCDTGLYRKVWTMPLAAALMNGCTGIVYLSREGWRTADVIFFVLEMCLTAVGAYGFRTVLSGNGKKDSAEHRTGAALLLGTVLISLSEFYLLEDISLGGGLAAAAVLSCAWQAGAGSGAVAGVVFGIAMDFAAEGIPLYAMAFGAAGLAAGLCRGGRRLSSAVVFVLADAAAVLWTWNSGPSKAILYEVFGGSMLFLMLPESVLRTLGAQLLREEDGYTDERRRDCVQKKLEASAQAFHALYESLRGTFRGRAANTEDAAVIFDRAADRICRRCALRGTCWDRDYVTTFNALNDATQAMLDRGRGEAGDFPNHFSSRCARFPAFLGAVNEELSAFLCRKQYNNRIRDSREAVCRQYEQLSEVLHNAAEELGQELTPDPVRQRRLRQHLTVLGLEGDAAVFYDQAHRLRAEISGSACQRLEAKEELDTIMSLMGVPMRREEGDRGERLVLIQAEPLMAIAGIAAKKKDGETVSGDAGTWFKRPDGRLYVLLCDGMGSGAAANRESSLAVRLLEQFLQAGVETEHALVILNSALALKGEEDGGFTTVDLLEMDLFTGECAVFKFGAAPTYIRKGAAVQRIAGSSLPAGLTARGEVRPDCTRLRLGPGDCVLMVSDGICGTQDDTWLRRRLEDFQGSSPKDLVRTLITDGPGEGATDDRTALMICLTKRGQEK